MGKHAESLLFKFGIIFLIFTVVMLVLSGNATYYSQSRSYMQEREEACQQVASFLEEYLLADGENFVSFQDYFMKHRDRMFIRHDFEGDWRPARDEFYSKFSQRFPGKVFGKDVSFYDMPEELQTAYSVYMWEFYIYTFEKACNDFGMKYTCYLVPIDKPLYMTWMLDLIRDEKELDGVTYIDLGATVEEPRELHQRMWEAWETGKRPQGYDTYDNEYGRTYAFYTPLYINGTKTGLIGVEVEIDKVNKAILRNTLIQMARIGATLVLCVVLLLFYIYRRYIFKLEHLERSVKIYAQKKDASIAMEIERKASGKDEIATLSLQVASMIMEIENYVKSLFETTKALQTSQEQAAMMSELAIKDALTGIRNKTAYDRETGKLDSQIAGGNSEFGIAMIDLNYLKRINDNFGHEKGNISIKKLCKITCNIFKHSPVFRIGGDEFVVILKNSDYANIDSLVSEFNRQLKELASHDELPQWERVSAAIGTAFYNKDIDENVEAVFRRADKIMYENKKAMKAVRE